MSTAARVKQVSLVHGTMFDGATVQQINRAFGNTLTLDGNFITACPNPSRKKDTIIIPMANVKSFVIIDEEAEALKQLELEVATEKAKQQIEIIKVKKAASSGSKGVIKFVKNKETGAIEEVLT